VPVVRSAVPSDAERIGEAHAEAWRVAYEGLFPADQLSAAVEVRRRMWIGLVGNPALGGTLLVAEHEGEVVGFIHFGVGSVDPETGEVYGFYVSPSSWGSEVARALMDRAVTSLGETFKRAILWTHVGAGRARRFYTKTGWTETGNQRQDTTWDGVSHPAVEYERWLSYVAPFQR
jgi:GNAT superfamily N-acetyltransferase